jgi:hypothetical protein
LCPLIVERGVKHHKPNQPYFSVGKNNDANIIMHGLKTNAEDMTNWLREGDVVFVDKCFRISLDITEILLKVALNAIKQTNNI